MGTKKFAISGELPYFGMKTDVIDKKYKSVYSRRDLGSAREVLRGFGYTKDELVPPESIKTYSDLMKWKRKLIDQALAG